MGHWNPLVVAPVFNAYTFISAQKHSDVEKLISISEVLSPIVGIIIKL